MTRSLLPVALLSTLTLGAATQSPTAPSPSDARQQAMFDKMRPGPEHTRLASLAGRWRRHVTFTMGGGQTMTATGTATNAMILGGRFLRSEQQHTLASSAPTPFSSIEAMSIYGFDRRTDQFTIVEFDTMGTYWVSAAGPRSATADIVMSGETLDDHGGTPEIRRYDMVLRIVDPDTYVTEVVFKFDGKPPLTLVRAEHRRIK